MHYFEEISTLSLMIAGLSCEVAITILSDKSGCDSKELSKLFPCALPTDPELRNIQAMMSCFRMIFQMQSGKQANMCLVGGFNPYQSNGITSPGTGRGENKQRLKPPPIINCEGWQFTILGISNQRYGQTARPTVGCVVVFEFHWVTKGQLPGDVRVFKLKPKKPSINMQKGMHFIIFHSSHDSNRESSHKTPT